MSTADTIPSITTPDSVEIQMGYGGPWKLLSSVITDTAIVTKDDKDAETAVVFNLGNESYWGNVGNVRFRIFNSNKTAGIDTITSYWMNILDLRGSLTLIIEPDTIGTNTHYNKSILRGN